MSTSNRNMEAECRDILNAFFDAHRVDVLRGAAFKTLRFLVAGDYPLQGNPGGWAGGIVYALVNQGRQPCGVPGLLNKEIETLFGVSMKTIRTRAAQVKTLLEI